MTESFGGLVDRLHDKIKTHMGWDDEKTNVWWKTKNPYFGGEISPHDYLFIRPDKIESIIDAMLSGDGP